MPIVDLEFQQTVWAHIIHHSFNGWKGLSIRLSDRPHGNGKSSPFSNTNLHPHSRSIFHCQICLSECIFCFWTDAILFLQDLTLRAGNLEYETNRNRTSTIAACYKKHRNIENSSGYTTTHPRGIYHPTTRATRTAGIQELMAMKWQQHDINMISMTV